MSFQKKTITERVQEIEEEDLQYIEADLSFYQLVSLGLLLYGGERSRFILQHLIVLAQCPANGQVTSDILRRYAKQNPQNWRFHIIEAFAIIRAKKVLRKLGLPWQEIYSHFLPHVAEISVHIHPLLKALYKISEVLTPKETDDLIQFIDSKHNTSQNMNFNDSTYLEIFILNWLNERIISIGNKPMESCDLNIIIEYFKCNDLDDLKDLVLSTINQYHNTEQHLDNSEETSNVATMVSGILMSGDEKCLEKLKAKTKENTIKFDAAKRYNISRENAGYVLIINQNSFYRETDPALKTLLPDHKFNPKRNGTDIDRDKLETLFTSFGYKSLVFNNLTHLEMLHQIRETVKMSLNKDSIIICILTHGMEGAVLGCNFIPVSINAIKEELIADSLKGKPKMLILQACQRHNPKVDTACSSAISDFSPEAYADILLAVSSIKGTESVRDSRKGSWFVESLCKFIEKYSKSKHMLDILTLVKNEISQKKPGDEYRLSPEASKEYCMLPETSTTLRKELYLP